MMNKKEFEKNLSIYDSRVENWPVEIRTPALQTMDSHPEIQSLIQEEREFEELLNSRQSDSMSENFANRIIEASLSITNRSESINLTSFIKELFDDFRFIKPGYAILLILSLGILLGFACSKNQTNADSNTIYISDFLYSNESYL